MSWLRNPGFVLVRRPVPVTVGPAGFVPVLVFAALFGGISARAGMPVVTAIVVGALGGTASLVAHELGHVRAARKVEGLRPLGVSVIAIAASLFAQNRFTRRRA